MLTQEQVDGYVLDSGRYCPHCRAEQPDRQVMGYQGDGIAEMQMECMACGRRWVALLRLVGVYDGESGQTTWASAQTLAGLPRWEYFGGA
jgi:hypothetical protein